jgi:hypothetical protein
MPQQEADVCKVATPTYQCCALGQGGVFCTDISTQHECNTPDDNDPTMIFRQWCGDTDTNLEPAAVAAIAATPLLIIAAAAGVAL